MSINDKVVTKINNNIIKIPSMESENPLIEFCSKNFKNIIISTGTSTFKEI